MFESFKLAIVFLTRLPIRFAQTPPPFEDSLVFFPLVGALIGAIAGGVFVAASVIGLPGWPAAVAAVAAGLLVTGALHEDGLADTVDGWGASEPKRALEIMRDSRLGTFGALALMLSLMTRVGCLSTFWDPMSQIVSLVMAGMVSRTAMLCVMAIQPPARDEGLGASAGRPDGASITIAVVGVLALGLFVLQIEALVVAVTAAAVLGGAMAWINERRLGGFTGDTLGAVQQMAEIGCLVGLVITA
ncbi:MAG: adenosylcobinamide-GDP ribazoletransferase [Geminicoccaceae bacterium]